MTELTVNQLAHITAKIVGGALLIVLLSYPIVGFANYAMGGLTHKAIQETPAPQAVPQQSLVPRLLSDIFPARKPSNTLVPPPPPISY